MVARIVLVSHEERPFTPPCASLSLSVFLFVRIYQHGSHETDFFSFEIGSALVCKNLSKPQFFFKIKLDNNIGKFTRRPKWCQTVHYISIYFVH